MLLQKFVFSYLVVKYLVEIVVVDDVDFAYVLLDVEGALDVERLVVHSLVVRSCCAKPLSPYLCCELLLLNNSAVMMLIFPMLEWMSRTLSTLSVPMSILLLSGLVAELAVLHIFVANFVVNHFSPLIVVVAVGSSTASESDVVAQLS